jgi:hypothetical protein
MRTTPRRAARQLRKFWGRPEMITIIDGPRDRKHFWRSPAVVSITAERSGGFGRKPAVITLTPGRVPGGHRLPLSTWQRSYGWPARAEPGSADRPERKKARRYG